MKDSLLKAWQITRETIETQGLELARWLGQCAGLLGLVGIAVVAVQKMPKPGQVAVDLSHLPGAAYVESRGTLLERIALTQRTAEEAREKQLEAFEQKSALERENTRMRAELGNWTTAAGYSKIYHIPVDMAFDIVDASIKTGIPHDLGFKLINVESQFHEKATSPVGARGLTQVMPGYRGPAPHVNPDSLYSRRVNLVVGFTFLRGLIDQYHGNKNLALVAYNRGPVKVAEALRQCRAGGDCHISNGYDRAVLSGGHTLASAAGGVESTW